MLSPAARPHLTRRPAALVISLALAACGEPSTPTQPTLTKGAAAGLASEIRPAEQHLHALAREIPGFGGYFIDSSGAVVGYVTDLALAGPLRGRLEAAERGGRMAGGSRGRAVAIRRGQFDFPSLAQWRDIVSEHLLGVVPGVVMSDADEAANRVTIGIDEAKHPSARAEVLGRLAGLGVPANAVHFIVSEPTSLDVAGPTALTAPSMVLVNETLEDVPSPVVAGYRIQTGPCTLGPVVEHNGNPAALTNSHCTPSMYGFDGVQLRDADFAVIGAEFLDPGPQCGSNCRHSDAALFYLDSTVASDFGRIARTVNVTYTWGVSGSIAVDQVNPTRDVIGVMGLWDVVAGMQLFKTGATTGTTGGNVSNTCTDVLASDGYIRACSILSTYYSSGGDSGSPVYASHPLYGLDQVWLVAIHWGSNASAQITSSSYFAWVTSEIPGSFLAERPTPLHAYITGPTDVNSSPSCRLRYEAVPSGGAGGGYTYSWNTDGVIHENFGDVVYAAFPGPPEGRFIEVTVTDGDGSSFTAGLGITSAVFYDLCYT